MNEKEWWKNPVFWQGNSIYGVFPNIVAIVAEAERLERERIREAILQFFLENNGRAGAVSLKDQILSKLSNE
jgi:hypothetical protein